MVDALHPAEPSTPSVEYVGFWMRFVAFLIDSFVMAVIMVPLLAAVYGWSYFDTGRAVFAG